MAIKARILCINLPPNARRQEPFILRLKSRIGLIHDVVWMQVAGSRRIAFLEARAVASGSNNPVGCLIRSLGNGSDKRIEAGYCPPFANSFSSFRGGRWPVFRRRLCFMP